MTDSSDLSRRRERLSPAQLQLLQQRMAKASTSASTSTSTSGSASMPAAASTSPSTSAVASTSAARAAGASDAIVRGALSTGPATPAQRGQWFLWRMNPGSTAYHVGGGLRLTGALDAAALRLALEQLVGRHEALRTVFETAEDGALLQRVKPAMPLELPSVDLVGLAPEEHEARRRQAVHDVCAAAFDLEQGPLLRALLLDVASESHELLLCLHHAVSDAWSVELILAELPALYAAALRGRSAELPLPEIRFVDFAQWQQGWLDGAEGQRELAWWRERLGDDVEPLLLPTDRPRGGPEGRPAAVLMDLPAELAASLRAAARKQGGTLFMALAAACHALLFRYTGQSAIRTGLPVANRNRAEGAGVVGFFVNTVVLQSSVRPRMTLAEQFTQMRGTALDALAHQELPFEQLVEALKPSRAGGAAPLFQVLFNHLRLDERAAPAWPGLAVERVDLGERSAPFELTIETAEHGDGRVQVWLRYASALFDRATIERLGGHYVALLRALCETPEMAVGDVVLPDAGELRQIEQWSRREDIAVSDLIHERFEAHARLRPEAVALVQGERRVGYGELDEAAERLAERLRQQGVVAESRVGLAAERSIEMVVGMLAILKAGGAYVPLDPAYPAERLAFMAQDCGLSLLLCDGAHAALEGLDVPRVDLRGEAYAVRRPRPSPQPSPAVRERESRGAGSQSNEATRSEASRASLPLEDAADRSVSRGSLSRTAGEGGGEGLAYVIYTSGSTGRPKGAQLTHANVIRLLDASAGHFGFGPDDVWTLFHSYAFDFSVWELFGALCTGGSVVLVPHLVSRSPRDFLTLLREQRVTVLNQTPSAFKQLMHVATQPDTEAATDLSLRLVIFGGEALEPRSLRPWAERFGLAHPRLVNMYGITETTVHVTHRPIADADLEDGGSPMGRALPDLGLHLLDSELQPVPIGVPGELFVSGAGLARGYLGRPGLTAMRFIADPSDSSGGRLYRTGDLARRRADGDIEYLGRIDEQVKIRGFRIELGEIESQLLASPAVREATVQVAQGAGGPRLVAFVTAQPGSSIDPDALRQGLATALPEHMVPSAIVVLDALPLNANGKLDRRALPMPEAGAGRGGEAPQGPDETALAAIWSSVLGATRVGRDDDFFDLGGHSLAIVQVQAKAEAHWGVALPLRRFFELRRLAALAAELAALQPQVARQTDKELDDMDRLLGSLEALES